MGFRPSFSALESTNLVCGMTDFRGVDQQHDAVDHRQDALDLAAEVGVAGGVDNIDAGAVPFDRGALGQDGDAALALQVVGIHGALLHVLVFAHRAGLLEQLVDQRGLAVVDVGDDGDIADVHRLGALVEKRGLIDAGPLRGNSSPKHHGYRSGIIETSETLFDN